MNTLCLIDLVLVVALVLVVPLTLRVSGTDGRAATGASLAGVLASISFVFDEGTVAAAFVIPWGITTATLACRRVRTWGQSREAVPETVAFLFLFAGAGWLAVSRYGGTPLGFGPTIVELTAVHFHYAGFVASIVTVQLAGWLQGAGSPRAAAARACAYAVVVATPITAAGITFAEWIGSVGAVVFVVSLTTSSIVTMTSVLPRLAGAARRLLWVSSLSVLLPMILAVTYATGRWLPTPAPSLRTMVWAHGLLNALGFALCGVSGWLVVQRGRNTGLPNTTTGPSPLSR